MKLADVKSSAWVCFDHMQPETQLEIYRLIQHASALGRKNSRFADREEWLRTKLTELRAESGAFIKYQHWRDTVATFEEEFS